MSTSEIKNEGGTRRKKMSTRDTELADDALDAVDRAEELLKRRSKEEESQQKQFRKLPLLSPGGKYKASCVTNGFRVPEGYSLTYNMNGDVQISSQREAPFEESKTIPIITHWWDGSLAWMYWTNNPVSGSRGLTLAECVVKYGLGGWVDSLNDRRTKVVFLDEGRSIQPTRCFIIAMDKPSNGNRIMVRGNEVDEKVFRVYRSYVPEHVQSVITLRELINARQAANNINDTTCSVPTCSVPTWWYM